MKIRIIGMNKCVCLLSLISCCTLRASEVKYNTSSGVVDLSSPSAWIGGVAPTENDTAIIAGTGGGFTLGTAVEWRGLVLSNLTANVTISGAALTLGEGGVSPGGKVSPKYYTYFECPVVISRDQDWYSINGQAVAIMSGITGEGTLTTRNYQNEPTGLFVVKSLLDAPWNAHASQMSLAESGAAVGGDVSVGWSCKLTVAQSAGATVSSGSAKPFSSFFKTGRVANDGLLKFGTDIGNMANVLFESADSITGGETSTIGENALLADTGAVEVLGKFKMTGGAISNVNVRLVGGDFIQEGGSVYMRQGMSGADGVDYGQRFLFSGAGATADVGHVSLGLRNSENVPNWFIVSNGTVRVRDYIQLTSSSTSRGANTHLDVAGGTFETAGVRFGGHADAIVTNACAAVNVTGGEVSVGAGGISLDSGSWESGLADELQGAWYKIWLSGGLYRAVASHSNTSAIAIEGEREISVDGGVTMTQVGMLSGPGSVTKTGAGTLSLPQICAWTGTTTVAAGTLVASGGIVTPEPYIVFRADDLALSDGASVTEWKSVSVDGTHTNAFTEAIANAVNIPALPQYRANRFGGHSAVVFNGTNQGLAMTGGSSDSSSDASPTSGATNLVVAVVFRATSGSGSKDASAFAAGGIVGQCYGAPNTHWALGTSVDGAVGGGISAGQGSPKSVWSGAPGVFDENSHVAFFSWSAGGKVRVNLDGTWTEAADDTMADRITRNRMLVGVSEGINGGSLSYFGGEIAEIRFYRNKTLTDDEIGLVGLVLAAEYGARYVPSSRAEQETSAVPAVSLPAASGIWCADDIALSVGDYVVEWQDQIAGSTFNRSVGEAVAKDNGINDTAAPTVSPEAMNGHKALRFSAARKTMLAMTGSNGTPARYIGLGGTNFTVAIVARPSASLGGAWASTFNSAGLLGMAYRGSNAHNKWGIGISGNAGQTPCDQVVMGIRDGTSSVVDAHGRPRFMCDGRPHVVICSFGTNLTVNVDGVRVTLRGMTGKPRNASRTTLGFLEELAISDSEKQGKKFFSGDIAEIRFYGDMTLTAAQQNALGRELAAKYGADMGGFCAEAGTMFASPHVTVAGGATLCGSGRGFVIPFGTVLDGEGRLLGRVVVGEGGILDVSAGMPTADAQMTFSSGGILRVGMGADGKVAPLHVSSVAWPASGGMTIDFSNAGNAPIGTVLSWDEGDAPDVSGWTVLGGTHTTALSVDAERKCVKVKTQRGMAIIYR